MILLPIYINSHLQQMFIGVGLVFDGVLLSSIPFLMHFTHLVATGWFFSHDFPKMNATS